MAQAIADAAWSRFLRMLHYKAEYYGVALIAVGRFAPTSKLCHVCGSSNEALTLNNRVWKCPSCGTTHDRDLNAAKNIKLMGLMSLTSPREPREEPVELSALAEASKQETPTLKRGSSQATL
jgi:putative transposase